MDITSPQTPATPHILLTSLGLNSKQTTYKWRDKQYTASLAPLALLRFLEPPSRPNRVVVVATNEAMRSTWANFEKEILQYPEIELECPVEIPEGRDRVEFRQIIESVAQRFPENSTLTLDITHGLRHLPFIFYALVLYLTSLRGVEVQRVFYGMLDGTPKTEPKPIIDLRPLLELPQWFYAVQMFRDQGMALPMAHLIQPLEDFLRQNTVLHSTGSDLFTARNHVKNVNNVANMLEKYSFAYEAALPLELGQVSRQLINPIEKLTHMDLINLPPLTANLAEVLKEAAETVAFSTPISPKGKWKLKVSLDKTELDRQARMIDAYLEREQIPLAVGLMREWVISWSMMKSDQVCNWLERDQRELYEKRLGAIGALLRNKNDALKDTIPLETQEFGKFWNRLTDELRNALHHHAMREDIVERKRLKIKEIRCFWQRMREDAIELPSLGGGNGLLLITPCGSRNGILASALEVTKPNRCLVISTDVSSHDQIASKIRRSIEFVNISPPSDIFNAVDKEVANSRIQRELWDADKIAANMNGDVAPVNLMVLRLIEEAHKLNRPVRRFVSSERTSGKQQRPDEYWLDK